MVLINEAEIEKNGVPEWYSGKNILITGSTGFMGKVLVEKLLRDCPDVNQLYLMIRTKRGVDPEARKNEYFKSEIFENIRNNDKLIGKIQLIKGDVLDEDLGLSENDQNELISKIDIVYHCAANVRFDQPLKNAVEMNVGGTLKMLKLAENMKKLKVFLHVSTSYCHCNEGVLEEREYPIEHDPINILEMSRTLNNDILHKMTPQLLNGLPNTYAFSKAVTEKLICSYGEKIPIVICRPSIVTSTIKEPFPGWVEGVNGPTGLMIGAARGIVRTMHCDPDHPATVVPCDTAINGMIVAAWDRGQKTINNVEFYNLVVANKYLPTWGECIDAGKRLFYANPLDFSLWYPDGGVTRNYYLHYVRVLLFHFLPAYILDFVLRLIGKKPFLVSIQKRISAGLEILQYYTIRTWEFKNERLEKLSWKLNYRDQEKFELYLEQIHFEDYIYNYIKGMRLYVLKEKIEDLPKARRTLKRLYFLDRFVTFTFYILLFLFLWFNIEKMFDSIAAFFNIPIKYYETRLIMDKSK